MWMVALSRIGDAVSAVAGRLGLKPGFLRRASPTRRQLIDTVLTHDMEAVGSDASEADMDDLVAVIGSHDHRRERSKSGDILMDHIDRHLAGKAPDIVEFEARFLVWVQDTLAIRPTFDQGTNSGYWRLVHEGLEAEFSVVGGNRERCLLRIRQPEPAPFVTRVKQEFSAGLITTREGGRTVYVGGQFRPSDILRASGLDRPLTKARAYGFVRARAGGKASR